MVEEKATLTSKLHLLADALKTFDVQKELHCDNEVDRNRVHPSLTPAEIERDWRACWQKPFLTLIGSYHCDSTWRQVTVYSQFDLIESNNDSINTKTKTM